MCPNLKKEAILVSSSPSCTNSRLCLLLCRTWRRHLWSFSHLMSPHFVGEALIKSLLQVWIGKRLLVLAINLLKTQWRKTFQGTLKSWLSFITAFSTFESLPYLWRLLKKFYFYSESETRRASFFFFFCLECFVIIREKPEKKKNTNHPLHSLPYHSFGFLVHCKREHQERDHNNSKKQKLHFNFFFFKKTSPKKKGSGSKILKTISFLLFLLLNGREKVKRSGIVCTNLLRRFRLHHWLRLYQWLKKRGL